MQTNNSLPEKFIERLKRIYSPKELEDIMLAIQTKPLPSFRTNTLKTTTAKLEQALRKQDFIIEKVPWYQDAFILKNKSTRELTETEEYKQGHIYIQNLSSMIPALVMNPQPDENVLDIAAAPGSKTTQIAMLMKNAGHIWANDISRKRLFKLETILKFYGIPFQKTQPTQKIGNSDFQIFRQSETTDNQSSLSVLISNLPGEKIWQLLPEYFDKTLVDVPCSMEGRIRLDDPETYQDWSMRKIKELEMKQKYLLRSAVSATKPGGTIVYSTCTLAPEENEAIIDWLLKKEGDAIALEKIEIPKLGLQTGLSNWNKPFNPQVSLTFRITPSALMEGFFVAKIKKLRSTITP